ncbi:Gmad2 immunoglobulin-like domain-containing protein [Nocardioides sp.]|uniref:Gmad2 immunoglobulin-like domain-containing protein n=1 Tax=Nocardioides sp. TaxID=35761 RepID=UPI002B26E4AD|nr:Gmad2 immunoglobulin-like domain-containing protein [Nocardioides sp.]
MLLPHRPRSFALRTAALAVTLGVLAGCGSDDTDPVASDPQPTAAEPTTPTEPTDTEPSEPTTSEAPDTVAAPIYFVGDSPTGPRLYREFRQVEADNPLEEGAALLVAGDALDPDYSSLLPALDIVSIEATSGALVVTLAGDAPTADKSMSASDAALAVQSLVYTLQGIAQTRDPLTVEVDGQPVQLLGQPTDTGVSATAPLEVLSLVNVTEPATDAAVSGTLVASGVASSFEATVLWEIRDSSGAVALDGFATASGFMDNVYPWETEIDLSSLASGDYTFAALTADPSDGEGPGPYVDTKTIVVP